MSSAAQNGPSDVEKGPNHNVHATPIYISPSQVDKLYLHSGPAPLGDLKQRFGNPTPVAVSVLTITLMSLGGQLCGFQGASNESLPVLSGMLYLLSGPSLFVSGILEWILGNTFPFVVFFTFGGLFLSIGLLVDPMHNIAGAEGATTVAYNSGVGVYFLSWAVVCFVFTLVSVRTNFAFLWINFWVTVALASLGSAYFTVSQHDAAKAVALIHTAGGALFGASIGALYLTLVQLVASVGFPFSLPVGDFSGFLVSRRSNA